MRSLFPGHYRPSREQVEIIWSTALIVPDANVLLNLYRYSATTADSLLDVLRRFKPRLWLPFQAAEEFHRHRLGVIAKQTKLYAETVTNAKGVLASMENPREHPFVDPSVLEQMRKATDLVVADLEKRRTARDKLLHDDPQLEAISDIFEGKVGTEPAVEIRVKRISDAKKRSEEGCPPGLRDSKKEGDKAFGDVLIWFEMMEHAKINKRPVIFVTDDGKDDWWLEVNGQTIGFRPELLKEFRQYTEQALLAYRPGPFVQYASTFLPPPSAQPPLSVPEKAIREMELQSAERTARLHHRERSSSSFGRFEQNARHLWGHRNEAREFLDGVSIVPLSGWKSLKTLFDIPPEARDRMASAIRAEPCVQNILSQLHRMSKQEFFEYLERTEQTLNAEQRSLMVRMRQVPKEAVEAASFLSPFAGELDPSSSFKRKPNVEQLEG